MTCLFCDIVEKKIPADIVYETDSVLAFRDINPQAPIHILIIPKQHIETINDAPTDSNLFDELIQAAQIISRQLEIDETGYRLIFNCNDDGGQEVRHIHLHLLGGRSMRWPPG